MFRLFCFLQPDDNSFFLRTFQMRYTCVIYLIFVQDPVFNTTLIVAYYWCPLIVLFVLYSFIFEAAWALSKKSKVNWILNSLIYWCGAECSADLFLQQTRKTMIGRFHQLGPKLKM